VNDSGKTFRGLTVEAHSEPAIQQRARLKKIADQNRRLFQHTSDDGGGTAPEAIGLLRIQISHRAPRLHIACQQGEKIAENAKRLTKAPMGVPPSGADQKLRVDGSSPSDEFPEQSGLAATRFAGDEHQTARTVKRSLQTPSERVEFTITPNKYLLPPAQLTFLTGSLR
jgi:hypothetical protein